jgi:hypothetical protein
LFWVQKLVTLVTSRPVLSSEVQFVDWISLTF